jgi:LysM repeat protein
MCGHDLRIQPRRRQRISWVDTALVLAVLAVLVIWWRVGTQPQQEAAAEGNAQTIMPTNIPVLDATPTTAATPQPTPTATPAAPEQVLVTHQVQTGETLLAIASQYGVTVEEIQAANNVRGELIRAGDELTIPVLRPAGSSGPAADPAAARFEYTVRQNDTIISIALTFGSTAEAILAANGLAANAIIRPGDRLIIPVSGVPPTVIESTAATPAAPSPADAAPPSGVIYPQPRLLSPPDGANFARTETVLLRWISVDVLQPNEWYVLLIYPIDGPANVPSVWSKGTSHRLNPELAPQGGQAVTYIWQISVVRVRSGENGQPILEAASPLSPPRRFTWQ